MSKSGWAGWKRAALAAALAVAASACDVTIGTVELKVREEKRFPVTGAARVTLDTFDGSVEVRGWDRPEVLIEVEKRAPDQAAADSIRVDARQQGGVVTVTIPKPPSLTPGGWRNRPSASLVASVPLQCDLVIRTGDGSVSVRRVAGTLDVRTDDGSVSVEEAKGAIVVRTRDGSVSAERLEGTADIETGDGSISMDGVVKGLRLETDDGSIEFQARKGSAAESDWTVTTGDGNIEGEVPKDLDAQVEVETGSGRIRFEGLTDKSDQRSPKDERDGRGDREERRTVTGTLGSGGKALKLRTADGNITVRVW